MQLIVEATEKNVGPFRADIVAKDIQTNQFVLVENQLNKTDHLHLGQLVTYGAGLQAATLVWIAEEFTEEHRAALDWLNAHTEETVRFFGIVVQLWRIGNSLVAPKFTVSSQPNDWSRSVSTAARKVGFEDLSETRQLQLQYWTALREYLMEHSKVVRPQKPQAHNWTDFRLGRSGFHLSASFNSREQHMTVALNISGPHAKEHYFELYKVKQIIQTEVGVDLEWRELPENKWSWVVSSFSADPSDKLDWDVQHAKFHNLLEAFYRVFVPRIRNMERPSLSGN